MNRTESLSRVYRPVCCEKGQLLVKLGHYHAEPHEAEATPNKANNCRCSCCLPHAVGWSPFLLGGGPKPRRAAGHWTLRVPLLLCARSCPGWAFVILARGGRLDRPDLGTFPPPTAYPNIREFVPRDACVRSHVFNPHHVWPSAYLRLPPLLLKLPGLKN